MQHKKGTTIQIVLLSGSKYIGALFFNHLIKKLIKKVHLYPFLFCTLVCIGLQGHGQSGYRNGIENEIAILSDSQAPLTLEKLFLKANHNVLATKKIFGDIINRKPAALFILGDVVSLGSKEKKWLEMDKYLLQVRSIGISTTALLGNHDIMHNHLKGEAAFNKRFSDQVNTGFYKLVDSIAFVLLNSNFKMFSTEQLLQQQDFYTKTMEQLDTNTAVRMIIVTCHHAPFSNSKVVRSNKAVQQKFVPIYIQSKKAKLFITGHAHDFEHFKISGKDFLTIGGGGGLHQPLNKSDSRIPSLSFGYDPEFHYLLIKRETHQLNIVSRRLRVDFSGFDNEYHFNISSDLN